MGSVLHREIGNHIVEQKNAPGLHHTWRLNGKSVGTPCMNGFFHFDTPSLRIQILLHHYYSSHHTRGSCTLGKQPPSLIILHIICGICLRLCK